MHYSYLVAVKAKYPSETDLAKFFGFFTAVIMIFSFVFKTAVYSKLMQTYGLKISLLIYSLVADLLYRHCFTFRIIDGLPGRNIGIHAVFSVHRVE